MCVKYGLTGQICANSASGVATIMDCHVVILSDVLFENKLILQRMGPNRGRLTKEMRETKSELLWNNG